MTSFYIYSKRLYLTRKGLSGTRVASSLKEIMVFAVLLLCKES